VTELEVEMAATSTANTATSTATAGSSQTQTPDSDTPFLDHFGTDLVTLARNHQLDPAEQRRATFAEIAQILVRRRGNSVLLNASSSADIQRTVHGLACALADGTLPAPLKHMRLLSIEGLQAGVKYRGQLEERLQTLIREVLKSGPLLLHFHCLADVVDLEKTANGSYFGPVLLQGQVQILTGARPDELAYSRKTNAGLVEGFSHVSLPCLDQSNVLRGLYAVRQRYAAHHGLNYADEALEAIATAAAEGDQEGGWQRALDLMDKVGARHQLEKGTGGTLDAAEVGRLLQ
jgi:ATP-dependent Clp protease ATP-binding subunit ClpC